MSFTVLRVGHTTLGMRHNLMKPNHSVKNNIIDSILLARIYQKDENICARKCDENCHLYDCIH